MGNLLRDLRVPTIPCGKYRSVKTSFNPVKFKVILPLEPKVEIGDLEKIKLEKIDTPNFDTLIDEQIKKHAKTIYYLDSKRNKI